MRVKLASPQLVPLHPSCSVTCLHVRSGKTSMESTESEWLGLERILKTIYFQPPCGGRVPPTSKTDNRFILGPLLLNNVMLVMLTALFKQSISKGLLSAITQMPISRTRISILLQLTQPFRLSKAGADRQTASSQTPLETALICLPLSSLVKEDRQTKPVMHSQNTTSALYNTTSVMLLLCIVGLESLPLFPPALPTLLQHTDVEHVATPLRRCAEQHQGWQLHFSKAARCLTSHRPPRHALPHQQSW